MVSEQVAARERKNFVAHLCLFDHFSNYLSLPRVALTNVTTKTALMTIPEKKTHIEPISIGI